MDSIGSVVVSYGTEKSTTTVEFSLSASNAYLVQEYAASLLAQEQSTANPAVQEGAT